MVDWNHVLIALIGAIAGIITLHLKQLHALKEIHTAVNSNYSKITAEVGVLKAEQAVTNSVIANLEKANAVLVEHIRSQDEAKNLLAAQQATPAGAVPGVPMIGVPILPDPGTVTKVEVVNPATSPVPTIDATPEAGAE